MSETLQPLEYQLTSRQYAILTEALRRYTRFHTGEPLVEAPVGYGRRSTGYGPAIPHFMQPALPADGEASYACSWWKLTEAGAKILQHWLDLGYSHEHIETRLTRYFPPHTHTADSEAKEAPKAFHNGQQDPDRNDEFKIFEYND